MIRILHVIGSLNSGGSQSMIMNLYRNIDRNKMQFDFVIDRKNDLYYADEIEKLGGKIYVMPQYKVYNHFTFKNSWDKFFKEHSEYRIIHGHVRSTAAIYLRIAKKHGLYAVVHSHSTSSGNGIKAMIKNLLQYRIRYVADYFVGCSQQANEWLFGKKIANSSQCIVLKNGIDVNKFLFNLEMRKKIRQELKIEKEEFVIGHVGRFSKVKNHEFLIDVFNDYYNNINKKSKLLLIGDGELKEKIEKKIGQLGLEKQVIIKETTSDIQNYYNAMDVFVFPSLYEGLGMVVVEAQVSGLECYVSDNIPKEVQISQSVNFIDLNKGSKYWSEAISAKDTATRNRKCKNHLIEEYDVRNLTKKLEGIYERGYNKVKK